MRWILFMSAVMTISQFYETAFVKLKLKDKDPKTIESYETSVGHWKALTPDKPLDQITDTDLADFLEALGKRKGKRYPTLAPSTLLKHCIQLQAIFDFAGPRNKDNKKGQEIITRVPYFDMPKVPAKEVEELWTIDELHQLYRAADSATWPEVPEVKPVDLWRAFFVFAYYTGMRVDSLCGAAYSNLNGQVLRIPNGFAKKKRGFVQYVHAEALQYIEGIRRPERDTIFPLPYRGTKKRKCYEGLRVIQQAAGLPKDRHFGFHAFRRTQSTEMVDAVLEGNQAVEAAQTAAGHTDRAVTLAHYISGNVKRKMMVKNIDRLDSPVPPEFRNGGNIMATQIPAPVVTVSLVEPASKVAAESVSIDHDWLARVNWER